MKAKIFQLTDFILTKINYNRRQTHRNNKKYSSHCLWKQNQHTAKIQYHTHKTVFFYFYSFNCWKTTTNLRTYNTITPENTTLYTRFIRLYVYVKSSHAVIIHSEVTLYIYSVCPLQQSTKKKHTQTHYEQMHIKFARFVCSPGQKPESNVAKKKLKECAWFGDKWDEQKL